MKSQKLYMLLVAMWATMVFGFLIIAKELYLQEPIEDNCVRKIEYIPTEVDMSIVPVLPIHLLDRKDAIAEAKRLEAKKIDSYSDYEIALMAKVVHGEAGNQDAIGKRLIVDVILNRVDSLEFPNTVEEVIYQKNQFCMYDLYTIDDLNAVTDEIVDRTDKEILFFRVGHFHRIGTPAYQYGDHYFSTM